MHVLFSIFVCVFLQLMDKILSKKIKDECVVSCFYPMFGEATYIYNENEDVIN